MLSMLLSRETFR